MPVYSYKGLHYELSETDPAAAKAKIMAHLGETPPETKPSPSSSLDEGMAMLEKIQPSVKAKPEPEEGIGTKAFGALEAAYGFATSIPALAVGAVKGIAGEVSSGKFGTAEGEREAEKTAEEYVQKTAYQPHTETGKAISEKASEVMAPLAFMAPEIAPHAIESASNLKYLPKTFKGEKVSASPKEVIAEAPKEGISEDVIKETVKAKEQKKDSSIPAIVRATDSIIRQRMNNILATNRITANNARVITEEVPEVPRREAVSTAIDTGDFKDLSTSEKATAVKIKQHFNEIGTRAKDLGILEGLRDNYISHIVDWSKVNKSEIGRLKDLIIGEATARDITSTKSRFGKERKYDTFEALQEAIKDTGLTIKTKDAAEIYKHYASSMERAIANKEMIENLKTAQAKDETGIQWAIQKVGEKTPAPRGWEYIDHPQMRGYAVNPDIAPSLKFVFDNKEPGVIMKSALALTQAVKRVNVVGSFFHAKSLLEANLSNWGVGKAGIDTAIENYKNGGLGDSTDSWLRSGLVVAPPEDVSIGIMSQIGRVADDLIGKVGPKTEIGERTLSRVEKASLGIFDKFTWDYLHTGLKLAVAEKFLEKARLNRPDIPDEIHRQEIARHVNNSFGSLNYFDVASQSTTRLGREIMMNALSPAGRRGLQLLMFAPDWTVSTIRAFTTALPKSLDVKGGVKGLIKPATQSDYARRYQLRTALIYATAINAMQMSITGKPLWENKDPTRLEFPDGTSMQLMKHAAEPYHWMADPDKTMANKLGFIPRALMVGLGGLQYASPTAPKLEDLSGLSRTKAAIAGALPFQISSALQAPSGEELQRAILGTLGFPMYGSTKEERRKERAAQYARKKKKKEAD
jgi:hypothetical protein